MMKTVNLWIFTLHYMPHIFGKYEEIENTLLADKVKTRQEALLYYIRKPAF